jgi:hypothetical protein
MQASLRLGTDSKRPKQGLSPLQLLEATPVNEESKSASRPALTVHNSRARLRLTDVDRAQLACGGNADR